MERIKNNFSSERSRMEDREGVIFKKLMKIMRDDGDRGREMNVKGK